MIGRSLTLDGEPYTVIGVMPAGFENLLAPQAQVWRPLRYDRSLPYACRSCKHLRMIGRIREGVDPAVARGEVDALAQEMTRDNPKDYVGAGLITEPMARWVTEPVRPALHVRSSLASGRPRLPSPSWFARRTGIACRCASTRRCVGQST